MTPSKYFDTENNLISLYWKDVPEMVLLCKRKRKSSYIILLNYFSDLKEYSVFNKVIFTRTQWMSAAIRSALEWHVFSRIKCRRTLVHTLSEANLQWGIHFTYQGFSFLRPTHCFCKRPMIVNNNQFESLCSHRQKTNMSLSYFSPYTYLIVLYSQS